MAQNRKPGRPPQAPTRRRSLPAHLAQRPSTKPQGGKSQIRSINSKLRAASSKPALESKQTGVKQRRKSSSNIHSINKRRNWISEIKLRLANYRKILLLTLLGSLILVGVVAAILIFTPTFKVENVESTNTSYTDQAQINQLLAKVQGEAILLVDTGELEKQLEQVPGVETARVERNWPNTLSANITVRTPVAIIESSGNTKVVDAFAVELPAAAAEGQTLPTFKILAREVDPAAVEAALLQAVSAMPPRLAQAIVSAEASTSSNLSFKINSEAGVKTVIWGSASDAELKVSVLEILLSQPGETIDLTVPEAPTIR